MKSLKGSFLIASRTLNDPNFARTVLLMIEHGASGAAGVVLNRPTGATLAELSQTLFHEELDWDKPIFLGGPVPGPLMVLHGVEGLSDQKILGDLFSTVDLEKIRELIRLRTEPSLFLANYAGWGAGQLEMELGQDSWKYTAADPELCLEGGDEAMWDSLIRRVSSSLIAGVLGLDGLPADPGLN